MYRIDDNQAVDTLPPDPTDNIGPPGYFTGGNPGASPPVPPTRIRYWWLNMIQETLIHPIITAGIALLKDDFSQLTKAIPLLVPRRGPIGVTSSGSTTIPAGVTRFFFDKATGGGGGGGGSYGENSGGSGGAGSPYAAGSFAVNEGDVVSWTIAALGGGGGSGNPASNGGAGGTTTIYLNGVAMVTITGGQGGWEGTGGLATNVTSPGTVTVAAGVDVAVDDAAGGGLSYGLSGGGFVSGLGGPSGAGAFTAQSVGAVATNGQNAATRGGGGGAGVLGGNGGAGRAGGFRYGW